MKKFLKEIIIAAIEAAVLFLFPLVPIGDRAGHIILIMVITLIVGTVGVAISNKKIKYLFPVFTTLVLVPTLFIYYDPSVYANIFWVFVFAVLATLLGQIIRLIVLGVKKLIVMLKAKKKKL